MMLTLQTENKLQEKSDRPLLRYRGCFDGIHAREDIRVYISRVI